MALFPISEILTTVSTGIGRALRVKGEVEISGMIEGIKHSMVNVTNTSNIAIYSNFERKYLLLINDSDTTMYITFGGEASVGRGIRLNAHGGSYEMSSTISNLCGAEIYCIHGGVGEKRLLISEGGDEVERYLFQEEFAYENGSTSYLTKIDNYTNKYTTDAIIKASNCNVQDGKLSCLIQSTVEKKQAITEFVGKQLLDMPVDGKLCLEARVTYPNTVETQFGFGFVEKNHNAGVGGYFAGNSVTSKCFRVHYGHSTSIGIGNLAVQWKVDNTTTNNALIDSNHTLVKNIPLTIKVEITRSLIRGYLVRIYENGLLVARADEVVFTPVDGKAYPYFYVTTSSPTSESILIDYIKVW